MANAYNNIYMVTGSEDGGGRGKGADTGGDAGTASSRSQEIHGGDQTIGTATHRAMATRVTRN